MGITEGSRICIYRQLSRRSESPPLVMLPIVYISLLNIRHALLIFYLSSSNYLQSKERDWIELILSCCVCASPARSSRSLRAAGLCSPENVGQQHLVSSIERRFRDWLMNGPLHSREEEMPSTFNYRLITAGKSASCGCTRYVETFSGIFNPNVSCKKESTEKLHALFF